MKKDIDKRIGKVFGRLTIIESADSDGYGHKRYLCRCDCGKEIVVRWYAISSGNTKSCGCLMMEKSLMKKPHKRKYNKYEFTEEYAIGYTIRGERFYFDKEDYDIVKDYCWRIHHGYVETSYRENKKQTTIYMHRIIFPDVDFKENVPDHINRIRCDNRKSNIRIVSESENLKNKSLYSNNKTGLTGVEKTNNGKWKASIRVNGKRISKTFSNFQDAVNQRILWEEKYGFLT